MKLHGEDVSSPSLTHAERAKKLISNLYYLGDDDLERITQAIEDAVREERERVCVELIEAVENIRVADCGFSPQRVHAEILGQLNQLHRGSHK